MKEVSINQIINYLDQINIIDIRDGYLYNIDHIPNAKNIPMNFLLMNPNNYLKNDERYFIYCNFGKNSKIVCEKLYKQGYDVINIIGGYNEYNLSKHLYK